MQIAGHASGHFCPRKKGEEIAVPADEGGRQPSCPALRRATSRVVGRRGGEAHAETNARESPRRACVRARAHGLALALADPINGVMGLARSRREAEPRTDVVGRRRDDGDSRTVHTGRFARSRRRPGF